MMTNVLVTIAHYLFGWLILTLALSWLSALIYPYIACPLSKIGTVASAFYTLLFALLAPLTALVALFILSSPTWAHLIVEPHCHADLCEPHSLEFVVETMLSTIILAMGVAGVVVVSLLMTSQLITSYHRSRMLEKLSDPDDSGYLRFENPNRIAWCFGIFKPRVFLSSGLVESLNSEQCQIILTHELAHVSQYDNLRKWLINWTTLIWPEKIKQKIRQDFSQFCESICDLKTFCALSSPMEPTTFVSTLKNVYGAQSNVSNNAAQATWKLRLDTLQRELTFQKKSSISISLQRLIVGALMVSFWLLVIATSVYLGHPLLENLPY